MVSENVQRSHATDIFLKAEVTLIKSILEQYCQLFSEYSESPVLFAKLEQRTNKSKLSASEKPSILKLEANIRIPGCLNILGQTILNGGNQSQCYLAHSQ